MPLTALIQAAKNKEATAARIGCLDELDRWAVSYTHLTLPTSDLV